MTTLKALKELQEDQNLVIRKVDKGNTLVLMDKDYYCNNSYETPPQYKYLPQSRFKEW